jgi:hypothetical protein
MKAFSSSKFSTVKDNAMILSAIYWVSAHWFYTVETY